MPVFSAYSKRSGHPKHTRTLYKVFSGRLQYHCRVENVSMKKKKIPHETLHDSQVSCNFRSTKCLHLADNNCMQKVPALTGLA